MLSEQQKTICQHVQERKSAELLRRLEAQPDIVPVELQAKAAKQGVRASTVHLWRILAKLGLRLKKSLHATEHDTEDNRQKRKVHLQTLAAIPPEDLIYVDESGVSTQRTRLSTGAPGRITPPRPGSRRALEAGY